METDTQGQGRFEPPKPLPMRVHGDDRAVMGRHVGTRSEFARRVVGGEHGQGFLGLGLTVLGGRNPCPYAIPALSRDCRSHAAAGGARAGPK